MAFTTTQQEAFSATVTDRKGNPVVPVGTVVWDCSPVEIATVTGNGLSAVVVGKGVGTATLTASVDGVTSSPFTIEVTPATVATITITAGDISEQP